MSQPQRIYLTTPQARRNAAQKCGELPDDWIAEFKQRTRSSDQNNLLHSLFSEVAKRAQWHGRTLTDTQWKVLFISGHAQATGLGVDMIPGLEGEFCNVRESSARMSVARMSSLLEYVLAWCATQEIHVNVAGEVMS